MDGNSTCKKITFSQSEGSREKGRPKLKWLDSVLKHLDSESRGVVKESKV
jgi:hypothetical protein